MLRTHASISLTYRRDRLEPHRFQIGWIGKALHQRIRIARGGSETLIFRKNSSKQDIVVAVRQIEFEDMLRKRQTELRRRGATRPAFEEKDFACYSADEIRVFAFDIRKLLLTGRARHLAICSRCQRRLEYWAGLVEKFDQATPVHDGKADA